MCSEDELITVWKWIWHSHDFRTSPIYKERSCVTELTTLLLISYICVIVHDGFLWWLYTIIMLRSSLQQVYIALVLLVLPAIAFHTFQSLPHALGHFLILFMPFLMHDWYIYIYRSCSHCYHSCSSELGCRFYLIIMRSYFYHLSANLQLSAAHARAKPCTHAE